MGHLLDLYEYRLDGRLACDIRNINSEFNACRQADGSVCWEQGNTSILAAVYGPHEVDDNHRADPEKAVINCSFSQSSFTATQWRKHLSGGRKVQEIEAIIRKTFESSIQLELHPRSQIDIFLEVVQSDGSVLSACINAATLALIDAGIPQLDFVCASSAAILRRTVVTDLSSPEDVFSVPQLTLAIMPKTSRFVQLTVSGRIHQQDLTRVVEAAVTGCERIHQHMQTALREHLSALSLSMHHR